MSLVYVSLCTNGYYLNKTTAIKYEFEEATLLSLEYQFNTFRDYIRRICRLYIGRRLLMIGINSNAGNVEVRNAMHKYITMQLHRSGEEDLKYIKIFQRGSQNFIVNQQVVSYQYSIFDITIESTKIIHNCIIIFAQLW